MSKANSEMQSLEHELHDSPKEEKENELRKEIHVLDKGDNLSSPNVFQVSPSLLLVEDLSIRNCGHIYN